MYYACCCLLQSPNWIPVVGVCHCCNFRYVSVSTEKTKTCQWHLNWSTTAQRGQEQGELLIETVYTHTVGHTLFWPTQKLIVDWITTTGLENYRGWGGKPFTNPLLLLPNYNMTTNQSHSTSSGVGTRSLLIRRITTHLQARPHVSTTMELWWWSPPLPHLLMAKH